MTVSVVLISLVLIAFQCAAWPILDKGPKRINGIRKNRNVKDYPQIKSFGSTSMASLLRAKSRALWYFSLTLKMLPYYRPRRTHPFLPDRKLETLQHVASPASLRVENRIYHSCADAVPHSLGIVSLWQDSRAAQLWLGTRHSQPVCLHRGSLCPCASGDCESYQYCYRVKRTAARAQLAPLCHLTRAAFAQLLPKAQLVYLYFLLKWTGIN